MSKLQGKVALITGGNSGMGLATARRFAEEGARVFVTGRRQAELDKAVGSIGPNASGIRGDVSKLDDLDRIFAQVEKDAGHLDIVFANAGVGEFARLGEVTEAHFDKIFDINVKGLLFTVQKALPLLRDGGSILLNASIVSIKGFESFGVYSASKAAVRSFGRTWANELKGRKIRVNVISPGPIDTPIFGELAPTQEAVDQIKAGFASQVPLGRMGDPDEIAKAALFLASDDGSFVNGVELFVDGGMVSI